jgi:protein-S-isoprenylcysteine O-methyltransferase Ste14
MESEKAQANLGGTNNVMRTSAMLLLSLVAMAAPFVGAGTLRWLQGWLFVILTVSVSVVSRILMLRAFPELAAERARFTGNQGTKSWDRVLVPLVSLGPMLIALVAGFEFRQRGDSGWIMPVLSVLPLLVGFGLSTWAMTSNPFFSSVVRIQSDRGHHVVSQGPYAYLRHPAYAAIIAAHFGFSLLFGSWWSMIPAVLFSALVVLRTALEDKTLLSELAGYSGYAQRVRYRLFPGIW